jgi:REP element-mobilizing transposase RayT
MARKLRIQYPGALYHVINRGNYRRDVFESAGAAEAFVTALREATGQHGWRVHAYVVMRNHYHLAVETPEPNLVEGMHWLQGTLATRFNRFRKERGHLFQGRYQSLLIENNDALCRVVDYIHLNPVRAGILTPAQLADFRWSSLRRFIKNEGFPGLVASDWLTHKGIDSTPTGWQNYIDYLADLVGDEARQKELGFDSMSRGWAIGTAGWRKALAKEFSQLALTPGLAVEETRSLREAAWEGTLQHVLKEAVCTEADLKESGKTAVWKVDLALRVRQNSGASIAWLANRMGLGTPDTARCQISLAKKRRMQGGHA